MRLSELDFALPPELIAQDPVEPRDAARLLVYTRADQSITHHRVRDLPGLLPPWTVLVANRSRVRKSRLAATRADGRTAEILVLESLSQGTYECMLGGKGIKPDDELTLENGAKVVVLEPHSEADFTSYVVDFRLPETEAEVLIEKLGHTPLPPYITNSHAPDERYQTVFAQETGSAAAPTAGLHFTPELIGQLKSRGCSWEEVVLHIGLGTFQPLRNDEVEANTLHHELTFIDAATATRLQTAKEAGQPFLAVGTTSCRTLESHTQHGIIQPGSLSTDLFIYPGYQFQATDLLFTNFHLPKSSLLLLVAARISSDKEVALPELKRIYEVAIAHQYRFFSFGDAMLVR